LENATVELGDELGEDVDWVRLYRILQAEQTALLSNRRYPISISSYYVVFRMNAITLTIYYNGPML
jgi:hypothetical protein